jgi:hypothetical protein
LPLGWRGEVWKAILDVACDRRVEEVLTIAQINMLSHRTNAAEALNNAFLSLNNILKFQRLTPSLIKELKLFKQQERYKRRYGMDINDPEMQRRIEKTVQGMRKRRLQARKEHLDKN